MAGTATMSIRLDKEVKDEAERFFGELGLTMSSAINIFIRQSLRQGKIPFELSLAADPFYGAANMAVLRKSIREAQTGKVVTRTMRDLKAMAQ